MKVDFALPWDGFGQMLTPVTPWNSGSSSKHGGPSSTIDPGTHTARVRRKWADIGRHTLPVGSGSSYICSSLVLGTSVPLVIGRVRRVRKAISERAGTRDPVRLVSDTTRPGRVDGGSGIKGLGNRFSVVSFLICISSAGTNLSLLWAMLRVTRFLSSEISGGR